MSGKLRRHDRGRSSGTASDGERRCAPGAGYGGGMMGIREGLDARRGWEPGRARSGVESGGGRGLGSCRVVGSGTGTTGRAQQTNRLVFFSEARWYV